MLIQYTPIAALSADQKARLRAQTNGMSLQSQQFVVFEGKTISTNDVQFRIWENETRSVTNQPLFG